MLALLGMPQGAEWLVILAIVVLLFGSAKLPTLVRQLGKSKKIWEDEIGSHVKKPDMEIGETPVGEGVHTSAEAEPNQRS
ncbi:twin-arginine translocase TatA/TatE family subunit [Kribbella sp. NBC_00709]|uniref:twin-arginine translocase TatA/TatE family subunit n=1 Tax=Kribbella sp. NBC_00709 TaxID=2975972 RepID=UPI002E2C996F|nr:twin-arginine translocase TatA/TatE family subunit [Kribbella sp. NBC_00709]